MCGAALPPRGLPQFLDEIGPPLPVARGAVAFGDPQAPDGDRDSGSQTIRVRHKKRKA